jgi:hypothetical protein
MSIKLLTILRKPEIPSPRIRTLSAAQSDPSFLVHDLGTIPANEQHSLLVERI